VWLKTFLGLGVVIVAVAVAMFSGLVLWLVAVVPFLAKTTLGLIVVRWLAHTAAARGLYEIAPVLWNVIPRPFRDWATRRYRHLWWWTMRRIVRNRRRVLRRLRQRERRAAAE
jgi:hypothetical protein